MDLTDKSRLIKYLKQNDLWAKKSLGQNFLVDREVLNKIVEAAELKKTDTVIEIGPGSGVLTAELVQKVKQVVAVEIDDKIAQLLHCSIVSLLKNNETMKQLDNLKIVNADILKTDLSEIIGTEKYKLVANIPYYITSKILEKFLAAKNKPELIVLLVQKEVAERICAKPGDTSVLSIAVQYYGQPEIVDIVKASSFFPAPKVDSAILKVRLKANSEKLIAMEKDLFKVVKAGFRSRRKTLVNNLMSGTNLSRDQLFDILEKIGLGKNVRAQELSIEEWIKLCQMLDVKCQKCM